MLKTKHVLTYWKRVMKMFEFKHLLELLPEYPGMCL